VRHDLRRPLVAITAAIVMALAAPATWADREGDQTDRIEPIGGLSFKDEVEVTLVNIIAHVTDGKGHPVTDLEADDFRVLQDGVARPITNFELFTREMYQHTEAANGERVTPPAADSVDAVQDPDLRPVWITIYVDNENIHPFARNRVFSQARQFIRANLRPPVQMMVASYERSLKVVQPFTDEPSQINTALDSMRQHTGGWQNRESARRDIIEQMARSQQNRGAHPSQNRRSMLAAVTSFAEEEINDLDFTLSALREMVTMLSGLPGKKAILYVANGLPMSPGLGLFYELANTYNEPSALTYAMRYNQSRDFESLIAAANAQDVTFYTIGAGGLEHVGISSAEFAAPRDTIAATIGSSNYLDSLRLMADATGGVAIVGTNDFRSGLQQVEQDLFTYYSLGYPLQSSGQDTVHRIEVDVPEHPEYSVRYRRRFVEKSLESKVQDAVLTGLMFPVEENPMDLALDVDRPAPASQDRWTVPVELTFPLEKVALIPDGDDYVGRLVLFIAARDTDGKQSDLVRQEHDVRVPAEEYDEARTQRFAIDTRLLMEKGRYRIAVGLMDQVTRQASYAITETRVGLEE